MSIPIWMQAPELLVLLFSEGAPLFLLLFTYTSTSIIYAVYEPTLFFASEFFLLENILAA